MADAEQLDTLIAAFQKANEAKTDVVKITRELMESEIAAVKGRLDKIEARQATLDRADAVGDGRRQAFGAVFDVVLGKFIAPLAVLATVALISAYLAYLVQHGSPK